jgi:hypothetical protein
MIHERSRRPRGPLYAAGPEALAAGDMVMMLEGGLAWLAALTDTQSNGYSI